MSPWPKGVPRKPREAEVEAAQVATEEKHQAEKKQADELVDAAFADIKHSGDPEDKRLLHFAYGDGDNISYEWQQQNPMEVPKEIRDANPGMRFRYRAIDPLTGQLRKGDDYDGWKVYKSNSGKYVNGKKCGADLILAVMPEQMARQRNETYQRRSTEQVYGLQESQLEAIDRAAADLPAGAELRPLGTGVTVGAAKVRNRATGAITEQYRGYHPEQLKEMAARQREDRAKNRTYSVPGQRGRRG